MKNDSAFRRNLLIVAALHVAFVVTLFVVSKLQPKRATENVMWLDGGSLGGDAGKSDPAPEPPEPPTPEPEPLPPPPEPEPEMKPALIKPPSEIPLATPEPATPKPITPKPATPKPATPKPATPKPATPKPATPKPATAKPSVSPKPSASAAAKAKTTPADSTKGTPGTAKANGAASGGTPGLKSTGSGTGVGSGKGAGREGGGARASEHGWYLQMIDERFRTRWVQPTDIERGGADVSTLLKVRINADGTIALREITKQSGYAQMDESVLRAAEKVTQLDPLPAGLGSNGVFEVNIQFKLDQGQ